MNIEKQAQQLAGQYFYGKVGDDGLDIYYSHLTQVVDILRQVTNDLEVLAAGWLHDIIEDTDYTPQELLGNFGQRVHDLVMEVTHEGKADNYGYYFPRLKTREGIMIKFADRLSNLTRMKSWPEARQAHYLRKSKFWND